MNEIGLLMELAKEQEENGYEVYYFLKHDVARIFQNDGWEFLSPDLVWKKKTTNIAWSQVLYRRKKEVDK